MCWRLSCTAIAKCITDKIYLIRQVREMIYGEWSLKKFVDMICTAIKWLRYEDKFSDFHQIFEKFAHFFCVLLHYIYFLLLLLTSINFGCIKIEKGR